MFDESFAEAWTLRYGTQSPPLPLEVAERIAPLLTHRSVRRFDTSRAIPEPVVQGLMAAAQSAATSANLQLYSFISVQDPQRRETIAKLCGDQQHVREAAWFFAVCLDHYRLRKAADAVGERADGLDFAEFFTMACVDAALAAERLVCAAQAISIGTCYIGALRNDADGVRRLLELPAGVAGLFGLCLGHPHAEADVTIKPRLAQGAIWMRERYDTEVSAAEYDERMRAHYEARGQKASVTWSMRSGRRVDENHLTGRERLRAFFDEQGLDQR